MRSTTIIGSYLSPYVRKVLVCLAVKGIRYEIDPIVPFYGSDEFGRISPVRRIPVLVDELGTICDSTVICEYLEDRYPFPPLLPKAPHDRAQARWLEEFADSRMGEVFIWHYYNQLVIRRFVWGEDPDAAVVRKATKEEIPRVLDYLEHEVPERGYRFGNLSIADVAVATFFRNAAFAGFTIDAAKWPKTAAFVATVLGHDAFQTLRPYEELLLRTPIAEHRAALQAAGAPVAGTTFGTTSPRRGVLAI